MTPVQGKWYQNKMTPQHKQFKIFKIMQQTFNEMMENAIVYLQTKGLIPKQPTQAQQQDENPIDWNDPKFHNQVTKELQDRGLLPKNK